VAVLLMLMLVLMQWGDFGLVIGPAIHAGHSTGADRTQTDRGR
jgi:hypothetical protein